jgi:PII-like signaling protein
MLIPFRRARRAADRRPSREATVITAKRIRIYVSEGEWQGAKPTYLRVVEYLRRENARGATVLRAVAGFGAGGRIRVGDPTGLESRLPMVVEWIDSPRRIERILPGVKAIVPHAPITAENVEVLQGEAVEVRELPDALTAADVMTRDVFAVTPHTPLREVVEGLLGKNYRAVPVLVDGIPAGIITNTDLVERGGLGARVELLAGLDRGELERTLERLSEARLLASDVMTREPFVIGATCIWCISSALLVTALLWAITPIATYAMSDITGE